MSIPVKTGGSMIRYNPKRSFGLNKITGHMKLIAKVAGIVNWRNFSVDILRPFSMSTIANNLELGAKTVANVARHSSIGTQIHYVRPSGEQMQKAVKVLSFLTYFTKEKTESLDEVTAIAAQVVAEEMIAQFAASMSTEPPVSVDV